MTQDMPSQPTAEQSQRQIPGYQLLSKLGQGGMGAVYKARQISLDRIVAIKVLPEKLARSQQFVDRFQLEGKAAAKLNHPNIIGALDVGQAGGIHYFVMEYVEGTTIFDQLMEIARYDEEEAVEILLPIARALSHAHQAGLIHRDVKPQNIMITTDGIPKLVDLGLARGIGPSNSPEDKPGLLTGSPNYMSPEQIQNRPDLDYRADIYSLGATFYYMVTGHPPYEAPTAQEVVKKHLLAPLIKPEKVNPRISLGVSQIIQVCLAKKPEDRYQKTDELAQDLESVSTGGMPLFAAGKLGFDALIDEELAKSKSESKAEASASATGEATNASTAKPATAEGSKTSATSKTADQPVATSSGRHHQARRRSRPLYMERSFWVAVIGWLVAVTFIVLWLMGVK